MDALNGSTFIHFEEEEEEWRVIFELTVNAICLNKKHPFDIDIFLFYLKKQYEIVENMKQEIQNIQF